MLVDDTKTSALKAEVKQKTSGNVHDMLRPANLDALAQISSSPIHFSSLQNQGYFALLVEDSLQRRSFTANTCWILIFSLIFQCCFCNAAPNPIVASFSTDDVRSPGKITHMQVHRANGKVYLGAVNRLYQLDPDLGLEESVVTGPVVNIFLQMSVHCTDVVHGPMKFVGQEALRR